MNDKKFNAALLLAILVTVLAVIAQRYFPQRRLELTPNPKAQYYLYSVNLGNGKPAASWLNKAQHSMRCVYPKHFSGSYYACSFNQLLSPDSIHGVDLSGYDHLIVRIHYRGKVRHLRLYFRNYNPQYARPDDPNSTKFNAVILDTRDLGSDLHIGMNEFKVADWWLDQYNIPRNESFTDFTNVTSMGLDFYGQLQPGNNDLRVEKIELIGTWISTEHWYLLILCFWMLGIFIYAVRQLLLLNRQTREDNRVINKLSRDKFALERESKKFKRLSTIDPLTETYNRAGINNIIRSLLAGKAHLTEGHPNFALMVLDIDFFKRVNDERGHDAGDRILHAVADILKNNVRSQDFTGRWGGEEFVVILPGTPKEAAMELAERLRLVVAEYVFEPRRPLHITVSVGVGESLDGEDFAATFKRVDQALYRAKHGGRNCCVMTDADATLP